METLVPSKKSSGPPAAYQYVVHIPSVRLPRNSHTKNNDPRSSFQNVFTGLHSCSFMNNHSLFDVTLERPTQCSVIWLYMNITPYLNLKNSRARART